MKRALCNSYSMFCPPVRGDNPRTLARGLSPVQVDNCAKVGKDGIMVVTSVFAFTIVLNVLTSY